MIFLALLALADSGNVCPASIRTVQHVEHAPSGWESYELPRLNELDGVIIFFDDPKTLRELPPDSYRTIAGKQHFTYVLPRQTKQVWVDCYYSRTAVVLRKRLPDSTKRCEVTHSRDRSLVESTLCN